MNNYKIVPLNEQGPIELMGVRFDRSSFMYWKNRNQVPVQEVVVVFSPRQENVEVKDGVVIVSLKGVKDYQTCREAMRILLEILQRNQQEINSFLFLVENEEHRMWESYLREEFQLNGVKQKEVVQNKILEEQKEQSQVSDLSAMGSKTIVTENNGNIQKVTIQGDKAYQNIGALNIEEQKMELLKEWQRDPVMLGRLQHLSPWERDQMLTDAVTNNLTPHPLESSREQMANDQVGEVAMKKAEQEDGLVNTELGIVQNHVSSENQYSAVERNGEDVRVVNPNVIASQVSTQGVDNSVGMERGYDNMNNASSVEKEEHDIQQREVEKVFYIDEEYNLYDDKGNKIGRIGEDGYMPNYQDNTIMKDGQVVGYIGDFKEMGRSSQSMTYKPNVRTLKKPERNFSSSGKDRGFVSLPVIVFIISALLLIASAVLLFVLS